MIRRDTLRNEFETATRAVAEQISKAGHKITVEFRGEEAYTNGSRIVLPGGDGLATMSAEDQAVIAGYTDHEAAHIVFTDFKAYESFTPEDRENQRLHEMANAIEDMRIEPQMMQSWAGTRSNFEAVSADVSGDTLAILRDLPAERLQDPAEWLPVAVTWEGRRRMGLATGVHEELLSLVGDEIRERACKICDQVETLSRGKAGTAEAIGLAKSIVGDAKMWTTKAKPQKKKAKSDEKDEGTSVVTDEAGDDEAPAPDTEAEDEASAESEDEAKDGDDQEIKVKVDADGDASDKAPESKTPFSVKLNPEALKGGSDAGKKQYRVLLGEPMVHRRNGPPMMMYETRLGSKDLMDLSQAKVMNDAFGDVRYQRTLDDMRGNVATMRTKLRRALVTKQDRIWQGGQRRGRFDTRRLVQAITGAEDVYALRTHGEDIDTAVQIVVDCSGSMGGSKINLAMQTTVALTSALEGTGVSYEVVGFTNFRSTKTPEERDEVDKIVSSGRSGHYTGNYYGPVDRVHIYEFKGFDEPLRLARRSIGNMSSMLLRENDDAQALLVAYERLKVRKESRKIMMVLSDGAPCSETWTGDYRTLWPRLSEVIKTLTGRGVTMIGIGIEDSFVQRHYPKWQVVKDASDLSGVVIDNVAKLLLGDKFLVDNGRIGHAA